MLVAGSLLQSSMDFPPPVKLLAPVFRQMHPVWQALKLEEL
jgi:hypothetical protein